MKYRARRIIIGLIIPIMISIIICGIFYYKNAHKEFMNEIAEYEGDTSEQMKGIIIRKDNWEEYFTLEIQEDLEKNDVTFYFRLKDEYHDMMATEKACYVNITLSEGTYLTWSSSHGKDFEATVKIDSDEDVEYEKIELKKISGELYLIK